MMIAMKRLLSLAAMAGLAACGGVELPPPPPSTPPTSPPPNPNPGPPQPAPGAWPAITATCEHGTATVTATPANELQPYKSWRVATANCGADITARFYTNGDQIRVAFEYQKPSLWESGGPRDYTATITLDGAVVAQEAITGQVPYTRWAWTLKQPEVIRTPAELVAAKLVLPFADVHEHNEHIERVHGEYTPLGSAGIAKWMPEPGGRQDFGLITAAQAWYMATESAEALRILLAQAEAAGSWYWNARDPDTGAALRFDQPHLIDASFGDGRFGSKVVRVSRPSSDWLWDAAHMPSLSYLPFLLTDDPYYLEGLQFEMNFIIGLSANIGHEIFPRVVHSAEPRTLYWSIRHVIQAAIAVPDDVPGWLVPGEYYDWLSVGNAEYVRRIHIDGDWQLRKWARGWAEPYVKLLGTAENPFSDERFRHKRWQVDYGAISVGLAGWAGLDEWQPVVDWQMNAAIDTVRHMRGFASFEEWNLGIRNDGEVPEPTWPAIRAKFADRLFEQTQGKPGGSQSPQGDDYNSRWQSTAAVIRVANALGYPDADKIRAWLWSQELKHRATYQAEYKWQVQFAPLPDVQPGLPLDAFLAAP